jgi:hypothetical protein
VNDNRNNLPPQSAWPHRLAVLLVCATFPLAAVAQANVDVLGPDDLFLDLDVRDRGQWSFAHAPYGIDKTLVRVLLVRLASHQDEVRPSKVLRAEMPRRGLVPDTRIAL